MPDSTVQSKEPQAASAWGKIVSIIAQRTAQAASDPLAFAQLVSTVLLIVAFAMAAVGWLDGYDRKKVEVPLLLIGVLSILLIVLRTNQNFAISVAVLIIGTVVAGDRFMLAVTALVKSNDTSSRQFVSELYGWRQSSSESAAELQERAKALARNVEAAAETNKPAVVQREVARVLEAAQMSGLRDRLDAVGAGAALDELRKGGYTWRTFVAEWKRQPFFKEHMDLLRQAGVIQFTGDDYEHAQITAIGDQLARRPGDPSALRALERLPAGPTLTSVSDPAATLLSIGQRVDSEFTTTARKWFRVEVTTPGMYVIRTFDFPTNREPLDSIVKLYNERGGKVAEDDDDGPNLLSTVETKLEQGRYLLEVATLDARPTRFGVEIRAK